jgi:ribosome biogenesis GTPase A
MNNKDNLNVTNSQLHIHWFPGHMKKTERVITENLKLIDVLVEITDARIPESGRNPGLTKLAGNKPRILLLNKQDYADESVTKQWLEYYREQNLVALACDCRSGAGLKGLPALLKKAVGARKYPGAIRVMAAGIPNSGKSSFINRMAGARKTKVGDRPGITRSKQWISASKEIEILDLPGVLPPRFETDKDKQAALNLAFTGAVRDEVMDVHGLAVNLVQFLAEHHADKLIERFKLKNLDGDLLEGIAKSRGMMISGGEPDVERAALALIDDFRGGKIGRITLEFPNKGNNMRNR